MFLKYIIVQFRYLKKRSLIAFINILSYGLGIAASLVLLDYIAYQLSFDRFFDGYENIYRVTVDDYLSGVKQSSTAFSFLGSGPQLKSRYQDVEEYTVVQKRLEVVTANDKTFLEKDILYADTNYFKVFHHVILPGGSTAAPNCGDVFLSETLARKYFDTTDVLGKTVKIFREYYTVKGIFKDIPTNTHLKFNLVCMPLWLNKEVKSGSDWNVAYAYTYLTLKSRTDDFDVKLKSFSDELSKLANQQSDADYSFQCHVQPLASIHLRSALTDEPEFNGQVETIYILSIIVLLILLITCVNYINLTSAINSARAKEAFVRKVVGASYKSTIEQRLAESLVINLTGFTAAILMLAGFIKWIAPYYELQFMDPDRFMLEGCLALLLLFMVALALSGVVPAILPSKNIATVSGTFSHVPGFSRGIAILQMAVSCIFISGAFVVLRQIDFMKEREAGYSDEGVIALEINALNYFQNRNSFERVKEDLEQLAPIEKVSFSSALPGEQLINTSVRSADKPAATATNSYVQVITSDYLDVYNIEMLHGVVFNEDSTSELQAVVNETLAKSLGVDDASDLNKEVTVDWARQAVNFKIVGVVKDFHHFSKKEAVRPILFLPLKNTFAAFRISIKLSDKSEIATVLPVIERILKKHLSVPYESRGVEVAFTLADVQQSYNRQYESEEQLGTFMNAMTLLATIMAAVGFFSLASSVTARRTKEMAIRMVHGARTSDVSAILSVYFLKLAGGAFLVAMPISYFLAQRWLNQFPNKVDLGIWFVGWPLMITFGVTTIAISYFVARVAVVSPTVCLRNE
jgi:putative ABC transport system permease protein